MHLKGGIRMGKSNYLNPSLTSSRKVNSGFAPRKVRKDKLHDIKIPVTEEMDLIIRREARKFWGGSKTSLGTELLVFGLENVFVYPEIPYQDSPFTVHVKVDHDTYQKIGTHADKWRYRSIRMAAHRIFMEAYKKKQLGGIVNEEI
jgi:hypothetical protein